MKFGRLTRITAVMAGVPIAAGALAAGTANAHGTMGNPVSRIAACHQEGPENPQSDVCRRLVAENGTQPLYDWNEVNIPNADGRHREIIPDGRLCSAGRDKYSGLDNPGEWRSTGLPSGGTFTFEYVVTAPHAGFIDFYVTTDDWNPNTPLTWDELEPEPFARLDQPAASDGRYTLTAQLPRKSGHHLVYTIWQRTDSPEAFYTCSDVEFGDAVADEGGAPAGDAFAPAGDGALDRSRDSADTGGSDHDGHTDGTGRAHDGTQGAQGAPDPADDAEDNAVLVSDGGAPADTAAGPDRQDAGETLPVTGSALTGLFLAAAAAMAAGTAGVVLARRSRTAGARHG